MNHRNIRSAILTLPLVARLLVTLGPADARAQGGWNPMNSGTNEDRRGVWGNSDSDVFAVGEYGRILHYSYVYISYLPLVLKTPPGSSPGFWCRARTPDATAAPASLCGWLPKAGNRSDWRSRERPLEPLIYRNLMREILTITPSYDRISC
jgi:hypothetical protein